MGAVVPSFRIWRDQVRALVTVTAYFAASHIVANHSTCGRGDGHGWTVQASMALTEATPTRVVVDHGEYLAALRAITGELDNRNLNDMLPGVVPTPEGIASYIHERLILAWPRTTIVSVSCGDYSAVLEWPIR